MLSSHYRGQDCSTIHRRVVNDQNASLKQAFPFGLFTRVRTSVRAPATTPPVYLPCN